MARQRVKNRDKTMLDLKAKKNVRRYARWVYRRYPQASIPQLIDLVKDEMSANREVYDHQTVAWAVDLEVHAEERKRIWKEKKEGKGWR